MSVFHRSLVGFEYRYGAWMSVSCKCCVLSDTGLCDRLVTRLEESYRVWCVWVSSWNLTNEEALAHWGLLRNGGHKYRVGYEQYNECGALVERSAEIMEEKLFPVSICPPQIPHILAWYWNLAFAVRCRRLASRPLAWRWRLSKHTLHELRTSPATACLSLPTHAVSQETVSLMFIGPCIVVIVEEWKTNLTSLATLFHLLCA